MNIIEELKYELAESLVLNFFSGHYYIIFDNIHEIEEFLTFINIHDKRYNKDFAKKNEIKSVMWKYSNNLYRHQLEWSADIKHFDKYGPSSLKYKKIEPYIRKMNLIYNMLIRSS